MHRLLVKQICDRAIDMISEQLFEIEESAMLSLGVENPDADLLLSEMHFPEIKPLISVM